MRKTIVISDVDGCLTDGKFTYTKDGKVSKVYGPHDNDGVKLLRKNDIDVRFISADKRGFDITLKRISDMNCIVDLVSEKERAEYIKSYLTDYDVVFFGDGLGDLAAYKKILWDEDETLGTLTLIAPANARPEVQEAAAFVTENIGGEGAFLDLALWVVDVFVTPADVKPLYDGL